MTIPGTEGGLSACDCDRRSRRPLGICTLMVLLMFGGAGTGCPRAHPLPGFSLEPDSAPCAYTRGVCMRGVAIDAESRQPVSVAVVDRAVDRGCIGTGLTDTTGQFHIFCPEPIRPDTILFYQFDYRLARLVIDRSFRGSHLVRVEMQRLWIPMHVDEPELQAILLAVLDSMRGEMGRGTNYLDPSSRWSPFRSAPQHPEPVIHALLRNGRFAGLCRADSTYRCDVPQPGTSWNFEAPKRHADSDTVAVDVGEVSVRSREGNYGSPPFGARIRYCLLRKSGGWRVVSVRTLVMS